MKNPPIAALAFLISPLLFITAGFLSSRTNVRNIDHKDSQYGTPSYTAEEPHNKTQEAQLQKTRPQEDNVSVTVNYAPAFDPRYPFTPPGTPPGKNTLSSKNLFDPSDDYWGLPRTEGVDEVSSLCSSCHSLEIVMQQRMTADRWTYTLNWMSEKQGMVQLDTDTYDLVYAYLTKHFSDR